MTAETPRTDAAVFTTGDAPGEDVVNHTVARELERDLTAARARVAELEKALLALANAADDVGVTHLDKEDLTDEGQAMLYATAAARALLSPSPEPKP